MNLLERVERIEEMLGIEIMPEEDDIAAEIDRRVGAAVQEIKRSLDARLAKQRERVVELRTVANTSAVHADHPEDQVEAKARVAAYDAVLKVLR